MKSIANHIKIHSEALNIRSQRNDILASNIVNSATPNFKARDIDFAKALNAKLDIGPVSISDNRHLKFFSGSGKAGVDFRQNVNPSKDGNTVEMHVARIQFSEHVIRYQTSLEFLNRKFSGLISAIKGE